MATLEGLSFTSSLGEEHRAELERLLFFNENQRRAADGIAHVARHYGVPRVQLVGDRLRILLGTDTLLQALFVIEHADEGDAPIGVLAYTREDACLVVLFVAVDEQYDSRGSSAGRMLLVKMLRELEAVASRVRGVTELRVYLGRREPTRIAVKRRAPAR